VGLIEEKDYLDDVSSAELMLSGKSEKLIEDSYKLMDEYSKNMHYERAALLRDRISSLRDVQRIQSVSGHSKEKDAVSIWTYNGKTKIGITHVVSGWVVRHENFIQKGSQTFDSILESFIKTHYLNLDTCPENILVGDKLVNKEILEKALSQKHSKKIRIITKPSKKDKGLLEICKRNTELAFNSKNNNGGTSDALKALKQEFGLKSLKIIESYDISHYSGKAAVGGCVVYTEKGKEKDKYRYFNISQKNAGNDIASMNEMIQRRFTDNSLDLDKPNFIIVDGGRVHLSNVRNTLKRIGVEGVYVISISKGARRKREMDLLHMEDGTSIEISRNSLAHLFIQEIRDESHRFSISKQKKKQKKIFIGSSLDNLNGIGVKRKRKLIRYFGSVDQVYKAGIHDLTNVPGLGKKTAESLYNQLH
tara:strand:- start:457 stop:1716 length:1260 start_codon:yes stop_codon:yes gene_type:complete